MSQSLPSSLLLHICVRTSEVLNLQVENCFGPSTFVQFTSRTVQLPEAPQAHGFQLLRDRLEMSALTRDSFNHCTCFYRALLVYCIIYHKAPVFLTYVCISVVVLSCVYVQMHVSMSMCRRSCLQVLYEFHLSAAWGTMWRISPNGLVCNCSVNTCLSRLGECVGGERPLTPTHWSHLLSSQ